jgi:hypothetical protein
MVLVDGSAGNAVPGRSWWRQRRLRRVTRGSCHRQGVCGRGETEGKLVMRGLSGPSMAQLRHRMRAPMSAAGGRELVNGSWRISGG